MYFDDLLNRLKKGDTANLVLLFGDSESVISEGIRLLKEKFKQKHAGGTILSFDGGEHDMAEILSSAGNSGLFATAQLLIIKNGQKILGGHSEAAIAQLKDYFGSPNMDSCLVFAAPGLRKTVKAVAAVEKMGWAVQCGDMPEWKLGAWVKQQAQDRGLTIPEDAVQLLVQKVGSDIAYLQRALEQLADYIHPAKTVTFVQVRELPVPGVESEIFPFVDAVAMRQAEKALQLMGRLEDGVDTGTTMLLYGRVRELLAINLLRARGAGQPQVAQELALPPFRLKNLWDQSSQFTVVALKEAMQDLIHLQAGVVTGRMSKPAAKVALEWWVLKWGKNPMALRSSQTTTRT